jgi:hypothetical protein
MQLEDENLPLDQPSLLQSFFIITSKKDVNTINEDIFNGGFW